MAFKVARSESLISGRVRVTFVSSSCIMPGTTMAIDCLRPIVLRILSAAAMAAGDGPGGGADVAAGGAGAAGGVVSAACADTLMAANMKRARRPWTIPARAGIDESWGYGFNFSSGRQGLQRPRRRR